MKPSLSFQASAVMNLTIERESSCYPTWWRRMSRPQPPPATWWYIFEEFTRGESAREWGFAAALVIAQVRRRTSPGPTFQELFRHFLPDANGLPDVFPSGMIYVDRRLVLHDFRLNAAVEWRRRGFIDWDTNLPRSLRPGPRFRAAMQRTGLTGFALGLDPGRLLHQGLAATPS